MSEDETPEQRATRTMVEQEQAAAQLRGIADAVVLLRKTLVAGGFSGPEASAMCVRAWNSFFPGAPLGLLFGGHPQ